MLSSASTQQAHFVLRFPILRCFAPLLFVSILRGTAAGIGTSKFLRAALILSLNFSSFGSIRIFFLIVWHCRVMVSRLPIFVSLSFLLHQTYASTYPAYIVRTRGCLFSSLVFSRTICILLVAFPLVEQIL